MLMTAKATTDRSGERRGCLFCVEGCAMCSAEVQILNTRQEARQSGEATLPMFGEAEFPAAALPDEKAYSDTARAMRKRGIEPTEAENRAKFEAAFSARRGARARRS
jgi:hypothetical protein